MGSVRPYSIYCDDPDALADVVGQHLRRHRLLQGVSRLGLAVSGGADSVALLHLLAPLCQAKGLSLTVLHANHGLREESCREADFVRSLADSHKLPCLTEELRLSEREADGDSLEMAARNARQAFFARCCGKAELDAVATGHQADDVAETVLLRLSRGAGCSGLAALRPRTSASHALTRIAGRPFSLIRPLLPVSARALREWLSRRRLVWCEDLTNQSCAIPRNLVRNRLLPQLEAAWGATFRANLCRSADILRAEDAFLEQLAERRLKTVCTNGAISLSRLKRLPEALRRRLLRQWLFQQGVDEASGFERVSRLLDFCLGSEATRFQLSEDAAAVLEGNSLILRRRELALPETPVPAEGRVLWGGLEILAESSFGVCSEAQGIGNYPAIGSLSSAALNGKTLTVRSRRPGDRLCPTGMSGSKKLQDVFVDAKIPEARRDAIPVFSCGDEVVWVPGYRVSTRFRVPAPDAPSLRITVRPALETPDAPTRATALKEDRRTNPSPSAWPRPLRE